MSAIQNEEAIDDEIYDIPPEGTQDCPPNPGGGYPPPPPGAPPPDDEFIDGEFIDDEIYDIPPGKVM